MAADASGDYVVVWTSIGQDGSDYGIFGQRYDSAGAKLGSEFRVNAYTTDRQFAPSVAADASGDFVVVWTSRFQDNSDGYGIFGQRYDGAGGKLGGEFSVNSYTTSHQSDPSVASDASGNFVVVWQGQDDGDFRGIFGQRYDSQGVPRGGEFLVNSSTPSNQTTPSVAADAKGNFVVVWDHADYEIRGQRFDAEGVAQGDELEIGEGGPGPYSPGSASVAADAAGNFVVAWELYNSGYYGPRTAGVFARSYDSEGVARGDVFQVNSYPNGDPGYSSVAADANRNFLVVWSQSGLEGSSTGVFGQRYDSEGSPQGGQFQINSFTTGTQAVPSAAATGTGQFVVAWSGAGLGDNGGVFGRRLQFPGDAITIVSPNANAKWRVGSRREIRWTHTVGSDATFRIKLDRDGDGEYEAFIAAAAPADSDTTGSFTWTVTGPPSKKARVRVAWTDDPAVSDASVTFQIKPAE